MPLSRVASTRPRSFSAFLGVLALGFQRSIHLMMDGVELLGLDITAPKPVFAPEFMKRLEGAEYVDVFSQEGTATVKLKPSNHVTVEALRDRDRKNGFTPKAANVTVAGRV
jgi:hypothetical protein